MSICLDFEIGTTIADLQNVRYRGIPDPDQWTYVPYSSVRRAGNGQAHGFGYPTASWSWETLSQDEVSVLLSFFTLAADASATVYIWTRIDTGYGYQARARYTAIMDRPVDGGGKSMIGATRKPTFSDVSVNFTHLESA